MKVFLVEDEIIVREGIKRNIDWEKHGLTFAGEASDGELAYPLICESRPDIVITDIKMPFMDGLELSRLVKKEMPWTKIVILSGHDDFEYAKEAISIGVTEYILKPLSSAKLIEVILKIKEGIEDERQQQEYVSRFQQDMQEMEHIERRRFFSTLIGKKVPVSELLEQAKKLHLQLGAPFYNILLLIFTHKESAATGYAADLVRAEQQMESFISSRDDAELFQRNLDGAAVLIKGSTEQEVQETVQACTDRMRQLAGASPDIRYFAAVGKAVQRLADIGASFNEANRVFAHRYFSDESEILYSQETKRLPPGGEMNISLDSIDTSQIDKQAFYQFLRSGEQEDLPAFLQKYLESFGSAVESSFFRQYIAMSASFTAIAFIEEIGFEKKELSKQWDSLSQQSQILYSLENTRRYLVQVIEKVLELRKKSATDRYRLLVKEAREYIEQNYAHDISLNQVAANAKISPNYFSTIFSQETGSTFVEYLTSVRMDKARELLRCSTKKTSEIANAAGYKDAHYFSYLFKKLNGMTPREYRKGKEGAGL